MATTVATAPGKVILFGEHAVVYGQPAIAIPVTQVRATAIVADSEVAGVRLALPDLARSYFLVEAAPDDPFAQTIRLVQQASGLARLPDLTVTVQSTIPIASGLGSGAATATAVARALARHLGKSNLATNEAISALVFQVEQLYHGTPSGVDNTVIAFERPVYFVREQPQNLIETFTVGAPLRLLVVDSGVSSATKAVVEDVRRKWQAEPEHFASLFASCGLVASAARKAIEKGEPKRLGELMNQNQLLLRQMTVSSPELERLVAAALRAGAWGAKLSGAGRGGNMIALVSEEAEATVKEALSAAGARTVFTTLVAS